ncbi:MAG: zinc ribbon domain-containing protein [Comamonadaceae bacterium]|nr:MAG: zinc ribbon domain-containing protein [Comamonadaceae bacterium]
MPIYAYKCSSCGFAKDALQKMSDAPLTVCPECGASTFEKQVTAAGFQLKGSGWYVTDFREGGGKGGAAKPDAKAAEPSGTGAADASSAPAPAAAPATASPAPAPAAAPAPTPSKND